jgi:hypothetical protein
MDILEKYKIRAKKRTLLLLAGIIWSFAGGRILTLGYEDLIIKTNSSWKYMLISIAIAFVFFKLVFNNMVNKHTTRIMSSSLTEHCIFSFFDLKGYIIMIFMITGGITLRNSHVVNSVYLGTFYIGLGSALLSAGIKFLLLTLKQQLIKTVA